MSGAAFARIYQCQSDTSAAIIYSVTQIYVLKGYKTAPQPSHPISQLITVSAMCVRVRVHVRTSEQGVLPVLVGERMIKGMRYPSHPEEMF